MGVSSEQAERIAEYARGEWAKLDDAVKMAVTGTKNINDAAMAFHLGNADTKHGYVVRARTDYTNG